MYPRRSGPARASTVLAFGKTSAGGGAEQDVVDLSRVLKSQASDLRGQREHDPVLRLAPITAESAQSAVSDLKKWAEGDEDAAGPGEALDRLASIPDVPQ